MSCTTRRVNESEHAGGPGVAFLHHNVTQYAEEMAVNYREATRMQPTDTPDTLDARTADSDELRRLREEVSALRSYVAGLAASAPDLLELLDSAPVEREQEPALRVG